MRDLLNELASHPASYGIAAAVARWLLGDRTGGWRALMVYLAASSITAWAAALYLADEGLTAQRQGFYLLIVAFVGKDLLIATIALFGQFKADPLDLLLRVYDALRGRPGSSRPEDRK